MPSELRVFNPEETPQTKLLRQIEDAFVNIEHRIENELSRSEGNINTWQSALNTNVCVIEFALDRLKSYGSISDDDYKRFMKEIDDFEVQIEESFKMYPNKENQPPQQLKDEYIQKFRGITSKIYLAAGGGK